MIWNDGNGTAYLHRLRGGVHRQEKEQCEQCPDDSQMAKSMKCSCKSNWIHKRGCAYKLSRAMLSLTHICTHTKMTNTNAHSWSRIFGSLLFEIEASDAVANWTEYLVAIRGEQKITSPVDRATKVRKLNSSECVPIISCMSGWTSSWNAVRMCGRCGSQTWNWCVVMLRSPAGVNRTFAREIAKLLFTL
jgi:hypothetical protein